MGPITVKLSKVDFAPTGQRDVAMLENGMFTFTCSFESEDKECLATWRVLDASFTDSLGRNWILLDEFDLKRTICSFEGNIQINFQLDNLIEDAHCLIHGSCLRITLTSNFEVERQSFNISHKYVFGPLVWEAKREVING